MDRRTFLAGGAGALPSLLAGCLGASTGTGGDPDSITLPAVEGPGSPSGRVAVRPPGEVALLDVFATWCAPCKPGMANRRAARERFDRDDVFPVSVAQESDAGAIREFWRRYDGTWPVATDPDLETTREYDAPGTPTLLVFAPDGTEVARHVGLAGEERAVSAVGEALAD